MDILSWYVSGPLITGRDDQGKRIMQYRATFPNGQHQFYATEREAKEAILNLCGFTAETARTATTEKEALLATIREYAEDQKLFQEAIEPFARQAAGIPDNWRPACVLTFEEMPSGTRRLNTLKEEETESWFGPKIRDWRRLAEVAEYFDRDDS